jgi:tetratricopeptide (TPR) repeat protein
MAEGWWYQGLNYYDLDRYPECEAAFEKLVRLDEKNGPAWAFFGLCTFRNGDYKRAFAQLVQAQKHGLPTASELEKVAREHYTMLAVKLGQFEYATILLAQLARVFPDTPMLTEMSGLASLRMALLPLEVKPGEREPVALAGMASIKAWQRLPEQAKPVAEQLLERFPEFPNVHYVAGWVFLQNQDPRALDEFKQEIARDPKHVPARLQLAGEYLMRGEVEAGLRYAKEAIELAPGEFMAHNLLGRLYLKAGDARQAIEPLETAIRLAPASAESHFALANAYQKVGRMSEAARHRKIFTELEQARQKETITGVRRMEGQP